MELQLSGIAKYNIQLILLAVITLFSSACCNIETLRINDQEYHLSNCGTTEQFQTRVLLAAIDANSLEIATDAVSKGAKLEFINVSNGMSPLMVASSSGRVEIAKLLLTKGAKADFRGSYHRTALMYASQNGYELVVDLLLKSGSDVNAVDGDGYTALDYAFRKRRATVIKTIMNNAADDSMRTKASLYLAYNFAESKGYKLNKESDILMVLLVCGYEKEVIEKFINNDSLLNKTDENNLSPLMLAVTYSNIEVIRLLISKGARINDKVLQFAISRGDTEIISLIKEKVGGLKN